MAQVRGRDDEVARLRSFVASVSGGSGSCLLIEGDAGIGKSRLVHETAEHAASLGFTTFIGGCDQLERARPFAAAAHALAGRRAELPAALWGEGAGGARTSEIAIAEAIIDALERATFDRPALLCLEDLHWSDDATIVLIQTLSQRIRDLPLSVVLTYRLGEIGADVAHLLDRLVTAGAETLRLGPLDQGAVERIAADVTGGEVGERLSEQLARAGGNPFYVLELLDAFEAEGLIARTDGIAELTKDVVPPSMRLTVLGRLAALADEPREIVITASFLGRVFSAADLAAVTGDEPLRLFRAIEPAFRAGVLTEEGELIAFRHDLVRSSLYDSVPATLRQQMHRSIGVALAAAGRPAVIVAEQFAEGAEAGDEAAIDWLVRAAEEVGPTALSITARLLERAADLCVDGAMRADLTARRVEALAFTFHARDAEEVARGLLSEEIDPAVATRCRLALAAALESLGRPAEACDQLQHVIDDQSIPEDARAGLTSWAGWLSIQAGFGDGEERVRAVRADAERSGERYAAITSSATLAQVANSRGEVDEAVALGLDASARAALWKLDDQWTLAVSANLTPMAELAAGGALVIADRFDEARRHLEAGRRSADMQQSRIVVLFQMAIAATHYFAGAWNDAIAEAMTGLDQAFESPQGILIGHGLLTRIHVHRGELRTAREFADRGMTELMTKGPTFGTDIFLWSNALLLEAEGEQDVACNTIEGLWGISNDQRLIFGSWRFYWPDLVRLAKLAGHTTIAPDVVAWAETGAARASNLPSALGASHRIAALAFNDADRARAAVEAYRASSRPVELASACEDAGVVFHAREVEGARTYLEEALRLYDELGATRDADRVRAAMRGMGMRVGVRGKRERPRHGWESLTPTELRVIEQVTKGSTNNTIAAVLFISPRTVATHLRNVFDKLGVSSRAELVATALKRK